MEKFHKLISVVFHPILLPVAATLVFFMLNNHGIERSIQFKIIFMIAIGTYIVPILMLFILKRRNLIQSLEVKTINERKIPVIFMTILFFILGKAFTNIPNLLFLSQLFLGCSLALSIAYFLFIKKLKISLHMIGMASFIAFAMAYSIESQVNITHFLAVLFTLAGIVANARIKLQEHSINEIIYGFATGFATQFLVFGILWI